MKKFLNYFKSFWKYYILKKPKLILSFILSILIYLWVVAILSSLNVNHPMGIGYGTAESGIYILFVKPIFVYFAGLIVINRI